MDDRPEVVVVTGAGGMGAAVCRRIGSGRTVILADVVPASLDAAVSSLTADGYAVRGEIVDVSDGTQVRGLASLAAAEGRVVAVVHTAGVSPTAAPARRVLDVNLGGTAHMIDAFGEVAGRGTAMVCVASLAGHLATVEPAVLEALATAPAPELAGLAAVDNAMSAYMVAKRGNQVRVEAAALAWSRRGARINSVSPGVIATAMTRTEADSFMGDRMTAMLDACGAGRAGTPGEVAEVVAFLTGPSSLFLNGTDIVIDGGQLAWMRRHAAG